MQFAFEMRILPWIIHKKSTFCQTENINLKPDVVFELLFFAALINVDQNVFSVLQHYTKAVKKIQDEIP